MPAPTVLAELEPLVPVVLPVLMDAPACPGSTMMLGGVPLSAALPTPTPQPGRDLVVGETLEPLCAVLDPAGVLGMVVPLTSPAGPGAIGVPPGPTRCDGMLVPDDPGATGEPPGATVPLFRVEVAGPDPPLTPGATGLVDEPAADEPTPVPPTPPTPPPAPPTPPLAPPEPPPAPPPAPPPVWAATISVVEARKAAVSAATMLLLPGMMRSFAVVVTTTRRQERGSTCGLRLGLS